MSLLGGATRSFFWKELFMDIKDINFMPAVKKERTKDKIQSEEIIDDLFPTERYAEIDETILWNL